MILRWYAKRQFDNVYQAVGYVAFMWFIQPTAYIVLFVEAWMNRPQ